jgi:hypothetical protein
MNGFLNRKIKPWMVGNGLVAARSHGEPTPSGPPTGNSGLQFAVVAHNERQLAIYDFSTSLTYT